MAFRTWFRSLTGLRERKPSGLYPGRHVRRRRSAFTLHLDLLESRLVLSPVVNPGPPVANAGGPYIIHEGDPLTLDGSKSTNPGNVTLGYFWFIPGVTEVPRPLPKGSDSIQLPVATGVTPTISWTQLQDLGLDDGPTVTTVSVVISDPRGFAVVSDVTTLTVLDTPPTATFGRSNRGPVKEGDTATFAFTDPIDPSRADTAAGFHYSFALDSGGLATSYAAADDGSSKQFTFGDEGSYTVYGRVFDKDNGFTDYQSTVVVNDAPPTLALSGADHTPEGSPYTLTVGPLTDPGQHAVSQYIIHWGDQSTSTIAAAELPADGQVQHPYADGPASRTITVDLVDEDGTRADVASKTITVDNVAPTATLSNDGPVDEHSPATVSFTGQFDPSDADTMAGFHYGYALSQDALATSYAAATDGASQQFTFGDEGSYTVYGRVFDKDNGYTDYQSTVVVNDAPPTLALSGADHTPEGSPYTLTVGPLTDPGQHAVSQYIIHWGDESTTSIAAADLPANGEVQHPYADGPATRTITVDLVDEDGTRADVASKTITVDNVAPTATLSNDGPVDERSPATVTFTGQFDPSTADTAAGFRYSYALEPEALATSYAAAADSSSKQFTFGDEGGYTVYGRIFDQDNGFTDYQTTVVVNDVPPTLALSGADHTPEGSPYTLTLGPLNDPGQHAVSQYVIHWGDESTTTIAAADLPADGQVQHPYADGPASRTITVDLVDEDGTRADVASKTITVDNVAPTATLSNDGPVGEHSPATVSFTGQFDPSDADTMAGFHYSYALSQDALATSYAAATDGASQQFTFGDEGSYTVYGRIFDQDNGFTDYQTTVVVNDAPPTLALSGADHTPEGSPYTLTVGPLTDPGQHAVSQYIIHWGDESTTTIAAADLPADGQVQHRYADGAVSPTITVDLVDEDGTRLNVASKTITVDNVAPTVQVSKSTVIGLGTTFVGSGSFFDPGADVWTVQVDYGDHTGLQTVTANSDHTFALNHTYTATGNYVVTATVSDHDGGVNSASLGVVVLDASQFANLLDFQILVVPPGGEGTAKVHGLDGLLVSTLSVPASWSGPVTLFLGSYKSDPTGSQHQISLQTSDGKGANAQLLSFYDVSMGGVTQPADPNKEVPTNSVTFFFSTAFTGTREQDLRLLVRSGSGWKEMQTGGPSGPQDIVPDTEDVTVDGTTYGGGLDMTYNRNSVPKVWEVPGTVFTVSVVTPTPAPTTISPPQALLNAAAFNRNAGDLPASTGLATTANFVRSNNLTLALTVSADRPAAAAEGPKGGDETDQDDTLVAPLQLLLGEDGGEGADQDDTLAVPLQLLLGEDDDYAPPPGRQPAVPAPKPAETAPNQESFLPGPAPDGAAPVGAFPELPTPARGALGQAAAGFLPPPLVDLGPLDTLSFLTAGERRQASVRQRTPAPVVDYAASAFGLTGLAAVGPGQGPPDRDDESRRARCGPLRVGVPWD
jgi:hypothetical protein